MMGFARFRKRKQHDAVPAELVLAIEHAHVTFRQPAGDGENERVAVKVAGLGAWCHETRQGARRRIQRVYPDMSPAACRRAADLLVGVIEQRGAERFRLPRRDRHGSSFVNAWRDAGYPNNW